MGTRGTCRGALVGAVDYNEDNEYPPTPEAEEICPLLPPSMQQPGTVWPCRVCGLEPDDPLPLARCKSETVYLAACKADHQGISHMATIPTGPWERPHHAVER
jgi:hypothetical protein